MSNQIGEQSSGSIVEDEIFSQIMGPERHGRVRGYGLGPTPTSVFGKGPTRAELISELKESNKHNEEMKDEIGQLKKMMEEERKKNEEDRLQFTTFMEEMRSSRISYRTSSMVSSTFLSVFFYI